MASKHRGEQPKEQKKLQEKVSEAVFKALIQVCGGDESICKANLRRLSHSTISFPNKDFESVDGKPHNVEIKVALAFYHSRRKRKRDTNVVELKSEFGLSRQISSPFELGKLLCDVLSQDWDIRVTPSGILCLVTNDRARALRDAGKLPCPQCVKWCKGEKGLWWHQQREHGAHHSEATVSASRQKTVLTLVPYNFNAGPHMFENRPSGGYPSSHRKDGLDVYEFARRGDLGAIKALVKSGLEMTESFDRKGASPLHWGAGSGQLDVVKYLVQDCGLDPNVGQRGKRSFSGRTALHWSARNGHIDVVRYLVEEGNANIDASTVDGTTAFGWACWQGNIEIMKYLRTSGCDVHKQNSYGCNAVLWAAQGEGETLQSLQWLHSIGCEMKLVNSNGHGALHKAAQRGRHETVCWLMNNCDPVQFEWVGPDGEGCCPSDLAGMEGHEDLARMVAKFECDVAIGLVTQGIVKPPDWLTNRPVSFVGGQKIWGANGGVQRIGQAIVKVNPSLAKANTHPLPGTDR